MAFQIRHGYVGIATQPVAFIVFCFIWKISKKIGEGGISAPKKEVILMQFFRIAPKSRTDPNAVQTCRLTVVFVARIEMEIAGATEAVGVFVRLWHADFVMSLNPSLSLKKAGGLIAHLTQHH
ncbi:hypothetical protein OS190_15340 [Sulfitobacter sp. F26204]|uniref:hypothetical protein n=1 Tax=Sulfitobacter sp. F26204 TaxID=2996014 RepID=UPI00225DD7E1|nr:hypothetical protein [Sulfitobacter sp. F26204]MCX7560942.1 hypothetical protein [Sulfitobacter sp. F26204]